MTEFKTAVRTIHADRTWWKKVLQGGAIGLTVFGWPVLEGFQLESIENTQRGFAVPLPRWNDPFGKAVIGLFALVLDFFFFIFPMLLGGIILFCGTLALGLSEIISSTSVVASIILGVILLYLLGVWVLGVSPVAKQRYVKTGALEELMSAAFMRELLRNPARRIYFRARFLSLPPYLAAGILFVLAIWVAGSSTLAGLGVAWLGASTLFYARLLTIQLYDAATRTYERQRFEANYQQATTNGQWHRG